nr:DNA-3-methyladenine glycosylase [uncultured Holophaga sp.]
MSRLLPRGFFLRPVATVARELLGMRLHHGAFVLEITETEAYGGPGDTASHCRFGRTPRNAPMWEGGAPSPVRRDVRVGIAYASPGDRGALLRFRV